VGPMKGSSKGRDREPPRDSVGPNRRYIEETSVQRKHLRVLRNPTIIHHGKEAPFSGANSFAILTMTKRTRTRMRTSQSRILRARARARGSVSAANPASPQAIPSGITRGRNGCLGLFSAEWTPSSAGIRNINMSSAVGGAAETMAEIVLNTVIRGRTASPGGLWPCLLARLHRRFSSLCAAVIPQERHPFARDDDVSFAPFLPSFLPSFRPCPPCSFRDSRADSGLPLKRFPQHSPRAACGRLRSRGSFLLIARTLPRERSRARANGSIINRPTGLNSSRLSL